jgi:hypothetical protein
VFHRLLYGHDLVRVDSGLPKRQFFLDSFICNVHSLLFGLARFDDDFRPSLGLKFLLKIWFEKRSMFLSQGDDTK